MQNISLSKKNSKKNALISPLILEEIKNDIIFVLKEESLAIANVANNFPQEAVNLTEKILCCNGRVVFSGMGKSGLIGRKIVATFASLGIPSTFIHPADALHGDLGMLQSSDLFIALSKSGSGVELEQVLQVLSSQGNDTALICCSSGSLSNHSGLVVQLPFAREACEMNLAPTSSSTIMLAFGDALAVATSKIKGFTKNDFAKFHPGGSLGKNLLLKVKSLMHPDSNLPFIAKDAPFQNFILTITKKKLGVGIVVDDHKNLLGIITDGDLRRACELGNLVFEKKAFEIMTPFPKTISPDELAYDALIKMENINITSLVVVENQKKVIGLIHIHDLLKAGIKK
ncbi:TPA: D-arabinose 5-phosphate isomerase [Candidatus Dependentiae bacterium]|nr:MAG: KpsF/GutQ family protein [candidate division TM6 bacterium GW2011_GWE2_31_21]KKP53171.1 MAG: KpsF/GutQ family protein [candidate division TM6 bacterium GW2011_GWF2_33_332]HBS47990.1 D-arabinose 5-phosphate isomerase [Candidatus Dependentiae bacterium]HBZ73406.1 D-arabinose 5-phosphate isomerase [Candidatus Dependentiae bacterium]